MRRDNSGRGVALAELGSLLPLAMIALLIANDHVLKFVFHNAVTGKLSDVAICFLMPLLASAALGLIAGGSAKRRLWIGAAFTVVVFSALEMSDLAGGWFIRGIAVVFGAKRTVLTRDPTDLLALACVPIAVAYGRQRARFATADHHWRRVTGALALVSGSLGLMATTAPERCGSWSAPMVFKVDEGGCGAGGLIVIEADPNFAQVKITNEPALLAPPPVGSDLSVQATYNSTSCPYAFDQGEWQITVGYCSSNGTSNPPPRPIDADATGDAGAPIDDAGVLATDAGASTTQCQPGYRLCKATLEADGLWFTCEGANPGVALCRSRLTVLP